MKISTIVSIIIVLVIGGITWWLVVESKKPGLYDGFASCLEEKGATFYGAFWCPHCQAQKKMFGSKSAKKLPYVECSTADGKGQLPICKDKNIESYPTWEFADGTRVTGEQSFEELAKYSTCEVPLESSGSVQPENVEMNQDVNLDTPVILETEVTQ